jgi:hypothetical protein
MSIIKKTMGKEIEKRPFQEIMAAAAPLLLCPS